VQATVNAPKLRCTLTEPGVVTYHVPLSLSSEHCAPVTGSLWFLVVTETLWTCPLTTDAQPVASSEAATNALKRSWRIIGGIGSLLVSGHRAYRREAANACRGRRVPWKIRRRGSADDRKHVAEVTQTRRS
jgi:hypothetical protein